MAAWADVVVCEWCGPNAVWYSQHKRPGQRLIVRLHRFELSTEYPHLVDAEAIDALVTVSPYYRELTAQQLPAFAPDRIIEIPNGIDTRDFDRPKLDGARFQIGMIGVVPRRKRLDRALDILETVRAHDPRFALYTKSQMPWEHRWVWGRSDERRYFEDVFRRVQTSPLLADSVGFDPAGPDVAEWLRGIGTLVSTSDDESFHMAPAEAMASGAVPVILDWPAARSVYDDSWISGSTAEAAALCWRSLTTANGSVNGSVRAITRSGSTVSRSSIAGATSFSASNPRTASPGTARRPPGIVRVRPRATVSAAPFETTAHRRSRRRCRPGGPRPPGSFLR